MGSFRSNFLLNLLALTRVARWRLRIDKRFALIRSIAPQFSISCKDLALSNVARDIQKRPRRVRKFRPLAVNQIKFPFKSHLAHCQGNDLTALDLGLRC